MRINNNLMAMNTHRQLGINSNNGAKSIEKLSSGYRINRAGDDAAGLAISEKMRNQIKGLNQASRNSQDGISLIQTAEGALAETHEMLQRMRELVVQSNNDTNTDEDLTNIQDELGQLTKEIDRIATKTEFNTKNLLDGTLGVQLGTSADLTAATAAGVSFELSGIDKSSTFTLAVAATSITATYNGVSQVITGVGSSALVAAGTVLDFDKVGVKLSLSADIAAAAIDAAVGGTYTTGTSAMAAFQIGANKSSTLDISISSMKSSTLGSGVLAGGLDDINVQSETFDNNLDTIDAAIKSVSEQRSKLGAWQNRLEHTIKNLDASSENLQAAESRIRDVDMAKEMMNFTKNNILQQAAQAMLAQANQAPQGVLQLLR